MKKTIETNRDWHAQWASIGQRATKDEPFQQVGRTVGGTPVSQDEIELIIAAIRQRLDLRRNDVLLDLCCGNGLITARLSPFCRAATGIDYSLELIHTAQERRSLPNTVYLHRAANDLHAADFPAGAPNKICMNFALQFFTEMSVRELLQTLRGLAQESLAVFLTDIPDAAKIDAFYNTPERWAEFERRRALGTEAIGTWWNRDHLMTLMRTAGFNVEILEIDSGRSTAHYRFDLLAQLVK